MTTTTTTIQPLEKTLDAEVVFNEYKNFRWHERMFKFVEFAKLFSDNVMDTWHKSDVEEEGPSKNAKEADFFIMETKMDYLAEIMIHSIYKT